MDIPPRPTSKLPDDWRPVIEFMLGRLWLVAQLPCHHAPLIYNTTTGESSSFRMHLADAIEAFPGARVDREILIGYDMPTKAREKYWKRLKAEREAAKQSTKQPT